MSSPRLDSPSKPVQFWNVTKPWIDSPMILGEGPYYEPSTHSIRWTDIFGKKIYWVDLKKGPKSLRSVEVEDFVGVTADIANDEDHILVAAKYGFATVHKQSSKLTYIKRTWTDKGEVKVERMRFNDGAVDSQGRFWAGSMTDNSLHKVEAEGAIFRLDPIVEFREATKASDGNTKLSKHISPVEIPNGIGWNPIKPGILYFTDSLTRTIWEYTYDEASGAVGDRKPYFVLAGSISLPNGETFTFDDTMVPDGFQFDTYGHLWTAVWGAGMVLRLEDVDDKRVVTGVVRVPARCSSCLRFVPGGGMVITTASEEEPERFGNGGPGAGRVFWCDVGVEGAETYKFGRKNGS